MYKKNTIEESIQIVQEWKASGLARDKFAELKGLTKDQMKYQIRKVRKLSPESLSIAATEKIEFTPVPQEHLHYSNRVYDICEITDQPALMFQSSAGSLQVTNQVDPYLLKIAMEVMLSC